MSTCDWCGRARQLRDGLCFGCRVKSISFGFQGGKAGWNRDDSTFQAQAREIEDGARETGQDIARIK